jgi:N-acetylglucosamine-6-sulfatase
VRIAGVTLCLVGVWCAPAQAAGVGFAAPRAYPAGVAPASVVADDFDGDGLADVAIGNPTPLGMVSVLPGTRGGGLGPEVGYPAGGAPASVAVDDFDRDGDPDLAADNAVSGGVSVLLGGPGASFGAPARYRAAGRTSALAMGDFNRDGDPDIAATNPDDGTVAVVPGGPRGSFGPPTAYRVASGRGSAMAVAVGDFNRDADPDLAVTNPGEGTVAVLSGGPGATFGPPTHYPAGDHAESIAIADFNADRIPDLAAAGSNLSVLAGTGNGSFSAPTTYLAGTGAAGRQVAAGDLDRDGDPDLAITNPGDGSVAVLTGREGAGFGTPKTLPAGTAPSAVAVTDLDRDGNPDIAVTNPQAGTISVLVNTGAVPAHPSARPVATADGGADSATGPLPARPNIILVLSDDQSMESVAKMPYLNSRVTPQGGWYRFNEAFINNATCCPSRATILTGLWSHHHGIESTGGAPPYDDSDTIATRLHAAGYRTGFVGKYHLGARAQSGPTYVPPGWDTWQAYAVGTSGWYYNYTLNQQGTLVDYGSAPSEYSTDVLRDKALGFIDQNRTQPFFLIYAPRAPHNAWTAAPRHLGHYKNAPVEHPPNFNEADMSDKPAWWSSLVPRAVADSDGARRKEWDTTLALDDAVKAIDGRVQDLGLTPNTVLVFMTDNGYAFGEHRYSGKVCQFDECSHTPLFVKFGDHNQGWTFGRPIGNEDLAPTFADLAGTSPPDPTDGQSFKSMLETRTIPADWDNEILLHGFLKPGDNDGDQQGHPPTFWGVRAPRFKYVETVATGEVELYSLRADPYELDNLAGRPEYADTQARLKQDLMDHVLQRTSTAGAAAIDSTGVLRFDAGPGVGNRVTLSGLDGSWFVADEGAPVVAGAGCEQVGVARVRCPQSGITRSVLRSGDMDDTIVTSGAVIDVSLEGEAGNDRLTTNSGSDDLRGGAGNDVLDGGRAADIFDGGTGRDTVTYARRAVSQPVDVDVDGAAGDDGGAKDGPAGSRDTVSASVENVTGGSGPDLLTGNDGPNALIGGGGADQLSGLAGDDTIVANGDGSSDQVSCGAGSLDVIFADPVDVFPTAGPDACEDVR